jgi:aspartyl/asparaginyl beta-hydroxylase (cupin superfamily)
MSSDLSEQADRALAAGDIATARSLLEEIVVDNANVENWLKLGSMCRALGDIPVALNAVERALMINPLDFTALLSRATLLEQMKHDEADEAYGRAIAQKPTGALPSQLRRMVEHAEVRGAANVARKITAYTDALKPVLATAADEEVRRITRFRDNALRITKPWHSDPTHFHYPELIEQEFHDRSHFPWIDQLEAATPTIAEECMMVMAAERAELVPYIQYAEHEPLEQWRALNHSRDWTAIHLLQNGVDIEANTRHCPKTMKFLKQLPQPGIAGCSPNAMFSLLAPEAVIPPHHGITNTRLVCHLPLTIPQGCWFRVGAQRRNWEPGVAWVFDDTIEHEAANPSTDLRIVFIFDVWHYKLSASEQKAIKLLLETDASRANLPL